MKKVFITLCLSICLISCNFSNQKKSGSHDRNMVTILDSVRHANETNENPYASGAKLSYIDSSMKANVSDNSHLIEMQFYKATALLEAGDEKQALEIMNQMLLNFKPPTIQLYQQLFRQYAITGLRLGERQNCITGHSTASCIMPIIGTGMHHIAEGSNEAIKAYTALLTLDSSDLESRWLINIAYMTLGEYPSKVPPQWLIPDLDKDLAEHPVKAFKDIAPQLRLDTKNRAGGMIVEDFNNDGLMDIVSSDMNPGAPMHFFSNNGNGSFTDISDASGISKVKGGLNIVQTDYNNDGFKDILVLRGAWLRKFGKQPNSLLRNNGNNTFTDVTLEAGLFSMHPTQTAVWRDFNNDGWLDLFIGNETSDSTDPQSCELFMSNRKGGFTNVAEQAGCNIVGFVKGVTSADYNNDGLMDIFISTCSGNRLLLKNEGVKNGVPHFEDVSGIAGIQQDGLNSFPDWFFDYDNDGWPDIFVCGYQPSRDKTMAYTVAEDALHRENNSAGKIYLYHNNHDGTFTNVAAQTDLAHAVFAMGSNFGDIDYDGYLDMYLGTGNPEFSSVAPNRLFRNIDGKKFEDVTVSARVGNLQKGHGVAFSDIDNDGDQDIFLVSGGAYDGDAYYNSVYLNPGQNNNHWIYIDVVGTKCNRSAIGSRIKIKFTEKGVQRIVYRDVNSGGSFGSSPLRREIGIGQSDMIDELTITWAGNNTVQTFKNIHCNQCIKITEGKDAIDLVTLKKLNMEAIADSILSCAPVSKQVVRN
ncbi:MAG: CRTAC1 family protein [Chitinophagaceae bacterium]